MDEEYFTIEEVKQRLKVTRVTIYAWMASGDLPYVVVGKHRRVTATALRNFIRPGRADDGRTSSLVSKARSLGIRVVVSMQTPTKQDTRWRGNLSTVLAGALQSGSQDAPALGIAPRDLRYRPSQLPPPAQRPGVFVCRIAGDQVVVQAPYLTDAEFDRHCAALPATPHRTTQNEANDLLSSLLARPIGLDGQGNDVAPVPSSHRTVTPSVAPSGRDVTPPGDVASALPSPLEIAQIANLLATLPRSDVVKRCGGNGRNYGRVKAKVDRVIALLASDTPRDKASDDLDQPGGPDLPGAFNF